MTLHSYSDPKRNVVKEICLSMNLRYIQKVFKVIKTTKSTQPVEAFCSRHVYTLYHPVTILSSPSRKYIISEASCKMMY